MSSNHDDEQGYDYENEEGEESEDISTLNEPTSSPPPYRDEFLENFQRERNSEPVLDAKAQKAIRKSRIMCPHTQLKIEQEGIAKLVFERVSGTRWSQGEEFSHFTGRIFVHCVDCGYDKVWSEKSIHRGPVWLIDVLIELDIIEFPDGFEPDGRTTKILGRKKGIDLRAQPSLKVNPNMRQ